MQPSATMTMERRGVMGRNWAVQRQVPWLPRLLGKFVLDILPAGLASAIGGVLLTQYQLGHSAAPRPVAGQVEPASAELMAMVRDEHAMIMNYLNSQMAAERSRDSAEDAAPAAPAPTPHGRPTAVAAKPARSTVSASAARPHTPLVIAKVQRDANGPVAPDDKVAGEQDSLLAKTLDVKDHVVAATRRVVAVIGTMFASVGERIGSALPGGSQFNSAS